MLFLAYHREYVLFKITAPLGEQTGKCFPAIVQNCYGEVERACLLHKNQVLLRLEFTNGRVVSRWIESFLPVLREVSTIMYEQELIH